MEKYLAAHSSQLFSVDARAPCVVHGQQCLCRTRPQGPMPLTLNIAGSICQGWSMAGKRAGFGHDSEELHAIWRQERVEEAKLGLEHGFFHECTVRYPYKEKLWKPLADSHWCKTILTDPKRMGHPTMRPRVLSACFAHDHCVWCGPDDVQKDFSRIFHMKPVETGDAYFVASAPEVRQDEDVFAKRRKMWIDRESLGKHQCLSGEDLVALLPVGVRSRLADHSTLAGETHLADVMQNVPSKGGRATVGPLWPTQLTNSAIWSWRMNRMACKLEHAQALGVHACAAGTTPLFGLSPLGEIFAGMSRTEVIHLCGNSMHLSTQLAWMCYVFCNIGFKSDPFDFFSFKRARDDEMDESDDDVSVAKKAKC